MFYRIENNNLLDYADFKYEDDCKQTNIVTQDELDQHPNKVIVKDDVLVLNPNYDKEEEEKEKERISNLTCTKRVLILMLEKLGLDYFEQIQPLIEANRQAKLEWELCSELQRKNPLLDTIGAELKITSEQLNKLFQYANGEIESLV